MNCCQFEGLVLTRLPNMCPSTKYCQHQWLCIPRQYPGYDCWMRILEGRLASTSENSGHWCRRSERLLDLGQRPPPRQSSMFRQGLLLIVRTRCWSRTQVRLPWKQKDRSNYAVSLYPPCVEATY